MFRQLGDSGIGPALGTPRKGTHNGSRNELAFSEAVTVPLRPAPRSAERGCKVVSCGWERDSPETSGSNVLLRKFDAIGMDALRGAHLCDNSR